MKKKEQSLFDILRNRISIETTNTIYLKLTNNRLIENQGTRSVINRIDVPPVEVKVSNWFDDILLYLKIELKEDKEQAIKDIPFISICFFQDVNNELKPLFRAEWDNFHINENDSYNHPQPHWHITNTDINNIGFEELNKKDVEEEAGDYAELFNDTQKTIDIYRMHFSMSGDWISNGNMVTKYIDNNQIVNWIGYLLQHVKKEIEYVK